MAKTKNKSLLLVAVLIILAGHSNAFEPPVNNGVQFGVSQDILPLVFMGLGSSAVLCVLGFFKTKRRPQLKGKKVCLLVYYSDLKKKWFRQVKSDFLQDARLNKYTVSIVIVHKNSNLKLVEMARVNKDGMTVSWVNDNE